MFSIFFKSMRQKNAQADNHGRNFIKNEDLGKIYLDFFKNLYHYKKKSEVALREVLESLPTSFTFDMNESLSRDITKNALFVAILSMAK